MEIYPMMLDIFLRTNFKCTELKKNSNFSDDYNKEKEEFINTLNEEQIKKFESVQSLTELHWDDIYLDLCRNGIYFGFKLGMEVQHFLDTYDD